MMKVRILGTLTALGLAVSMGATKAEAQTAVASINANATVLAALTATPQGDLDFGNVFPGTAKGVLTSDAAAGSIQINGVLNAEITVSFPTLPANLQDVALNNLPIAFSNTDAAWFGSNARASATAFDPATGLTNRLHNATGDMWIFVGGTVTATTQPAGAYTAQITLNAAYTGN